MSVDPAHMFAEADIFHPAAVPPYRTWGVMGMRLQRRLEALASARLERAGYVEIRLPSICQAAPLEHYLGHKADRLVAIAAKPGRGRLALAPFADLQFVEHFGALRRRSDSVIPIPEKVYQWSRAVLDEAQGGLLDFGEYLKCEVFSLHRKPKQALRAWEQLNDVLRSLCIDDLNLDVTCGMRPPVTAFPLTARTFAAELSQSPDGFQTVAVSHVMAPAFMAANGFDSFACALLNSACFSQKLLANLLLNHQDAKGLCVPPALAPSLGVLVGPDATRVAQLQDRSVAAHHRLTFRPDLRDPVRALLDAGATWSLAACSDDRGRATWLLYRRGELDAPPQAHSSLDTALEAAAQYVDAFGRRLATQSRERTRAGLREAIVRASAQAASGDRVVPCCQRRCCQAKLVETDPGLPKLRFQLNSELRCANCGRPTSWFLLFETEERYTSFYVASRAAERMNEQCQLAQA